MIEDDKDYYTRRAEAELERAQRAKKPEVVKAHYLIAEAYLERLYTADCESVEKAA